MAGIVVKPETTVRSPETLLPGMLWLYPDVLDASDAQARYQHLADSIPWQQPTLRLFGRDCKIPRLQAWYGDQGTQYRYSGLAMEPLNWTPPLQALRERCQQVTGYAYNSVLVNWYRDGRDSMGFHSDNEPELGPEPVIASLSLGEVRRFRLRRKDKTEQLTLDLPPGSLLLMAGPLQAQWQHGLPKTSRPCLGRINLTFRWIFAQSGPKMGNGPPRPSNA